MKSKYVLWGVAAVVVVAALAFFLSRGGKTPSQTANMPAAGQTAVSGNSNGASGVAPSGQQAISPVNTNLGSVSGVDLSAFGAQANQSSSLVSQEGVSDAQAVSSDGANINSSTDSVNNPIQ